MNLVSMQRQEVSRIPHFDGIIYILSGTPLCPFDCDCCEFPASALIGKNDWPGVGFWTTMVFLTHMSWTGHISQWFYKVCRLYRSLLDRDIATVIGGQCVAKKTRQVPFACTAGCSCLDSITIYSMVVRDILLFKLLPMIAHGMCHATCISVPLCYI